jgi:CxxC motif-containing protein (DUF1111 family)
VNTTLSVLRQLGRAASLVALATHATGQRAGVTVVDASANAFAYPLPDLTAAERRAFVVGNSFFKQNWVAAPASAAERDGLGPLFNARSCSSCHLRDGRSAPPADGDVDRHGLLVRIGVRRADGGPDEPHPHYGAQIQDQALPGLVAEAQVALGIETVPGSYGDGTPFELLRIEPRLVALAHGDLGDDAVLGARTAPHLVGLGLLEAIPAAAITAAADPDDRDGDGVSGRAHWLGDDGTPPLGRFGWKATQPTVHAQTAAAFVHDMGITSPVHPHEVLTATQRESLQFTSGGAPEIDAATFDRVVFYTRTIAVPQPRTDGGEPVARGREAFAAFGCAGCHTPQWTTGGADDSDVPALRGRTIAPYTDLLLHDLGPELADGKRDGEAAPGEWRTAPLWGIGLIPVVNGHERLLHDGRARGVAEAILWHGGEAAAARERFRRAPAAERAALVAFVRSL